MPSPATHNARGARASLAWAALAAVLVALGWNTYYRAVDSPQRRSDFLVFYQAAQTLADGRDVYQVRHERGWGFYYPPALPALLAPIARLPLGAAVVAWYALSAGALVWSARRLVRLADALAGRAMGAWVVALHAANLGPIASGLQRGQISMLLVALMVEAFWCYRARRTGWAGVCVGVAAALKVYPAILALPLLLRREWRALGAMAATLLVLWGAAPMLVAGPAAGWRTNERFVRHVLTPFALKADAAGGDVLTRVNYFGPTNQSLYAFGGRWLCRDAIAPNDRFAWTLANFDPRVVRRIAAIPAALLLLTLAALCLQAAPRCDWREAALWALLIAAPCFVSDVAWHHYYTAMTPAYVVTLVGAVDRRGSRLAPALLAAVLGGAAHFVSYTVRQTGALMLVNLLLWCVLAAAVARRGRRPDRLFGAADS